MSVLWLWKVQRSKKQLNPPTSIFLCCCKVVLFGHVCLHWVCLKAGECLDHLSALSGGLRAAGRWKILIIISIASSANKRNRSSQGLSLYSHHSQPFKTTLSWTLKKSDPNPTGRALQETKTNRDKHPNQPHMKVGMGPERGAEMHCEFLRMRGKLWGGQPYRRVNFTEGPT